MSAQIKVGSFTQAATAVAYNISIGFVPTYFKITNFTDGDYEEWYTGMTDAHGVLSVAGTAFQGVRTAITANGITPSGDAAGDTFKGVTFGLNTSINIASKVYRWVAIKSDQ